MKGSKNKKSYLIAAVLIALIVAVPLTVMLLTREQPPQETPSGTVSVTVSIDCRTLFLPENAALKEQVFAALGEEGRAMLGEDGTVVQNAVVKTEGGGTVLDALQSVADRYGLPVSARGGYVASLAGLPEKLTDEGGWLYSVNGVYAVVGAGSKPLADGDVIRWRYSLQKGDLDVCP